MIYIRYTISKISFSYIMYITIILCRNYLQIVRSNYVYFGQINESVCLYVCLVVSVLASHAVGRGFTFWSGHTKDYKKGRNCLPAWHAGVKVGV